MKRALAAMMSSCAEGSWALGICGSTARHGLRAQDPDALLEHSDGLEMRERGRSGGLQSLQWAGAA